MAMNLADLRFDHPRLFWTGTVALSSCLLVAGFFALPENHFMQATGITSAQQRLIALKNAVYWYSRSLIHASAKDLHFDTRFGNVVSYSDALHTSMPIGEDFEDVKLHFADVLIVSPSDANRIVEAARFKDAKFEIYDGDKSVVWIGGKPLNITMIEEGAATPDPNPPTNIVDVAFASYYWGQFKGERQ